MRRNKRSFLNRRTFLRGTGSLALALPFLDSLRPRDVHADEANDGPEMVIFVVHMQGTVPKYWLPNGTENSFQMPKLLQRLEPWKDRLNVIAGVSNFAKDETSESLDGHLRAQPTLLTSNIHGGTVDLAAGPSIDQVLAGRLSKGVPFRSLDLSVGTNGDALNSQQGNIFHAAADDQVTSQANPMAVFESLFATGEMGGVGLESLRQRRLSVLDMVGDQFDAIRNRLSAEDRIRLDAHAEKIRQLEKQFETAAKPIAECSPPVLNIPSNFDVILDEPNSARAHIDLMTMALACGLTRVGTIMFPNQYFNQFPWLDADGGPVVEARNWHEQIHQGNLPPGESTDVPYENFEPRAGTLAVFDWYAEQVANLLQALEAVDAGGGRTLLDRTMVVWLSDFSEGGWHSTYNLPVVVAGNTGSTTGRFINHMQSNWWEDKAGTASTAQLYVSMLRAFGFDDTTFGYEGDWAQGPLPLF